MTNRPAMKRIPDLGAARAAGICFLTALWVISPALVEISGTWLFLAPTRGSLVCRLSPCGVRLSCASGVLIKCALCVRSLEDEEGCRRVKDCRERYFLGRWARVGCISWRPAARCDPISLVACGRSFRRPIASPSMPGVTGSLAATAATCVLILVLAIALHAALLILSGLFGRLGGPSTHLSSPLLYATVCVHRGVLASMRLITVGLDDIAVVGI